MFLLCENNPVMPKKLILMVDQYSYRKLYFLRESACGQGWSFQFKRPINLDENRITSSKIKSESQE